MPRDKSNENAINKTCVTSSIMSIIPSKETVVFWDCCSSTIVIKEMCRDLNMRRKPLWNSISENNSADVGSIIITKEAYHKMQHWKERDLLKPMENHYKR